MHLSLFDDPNKAARVLYAQYWQRKLKDNKDVSFPDSLLTVIADETERFSFAYLKEALYVFSTTFLSHSPRLADSSVSALVTLLTEKEDGHPVTFETAIRKQIKILRKQLDEVAPKCNTTQVSAEVFPRSSTEKQDSRPVLDGLCQRLRQAENSVGPILPRPDFDIRGLMGDLQSGNRYWF